MDIPVFSFNDIADYTEAIKLINDDSFFINNRIYNAIKYGINNYLLSVYLYDLNLKNGMTYSVKCLRIKWEELLTDANKYFEEIEEYEKCSEIMKLIIKLNDGEFNAK